VPRQLAASLPDVPRWIETRAMLGADGAVVIGGSSVADGFVVRVLRGALSAVAVVGHPPADAVLRAVEGTTPMTPVLAGAENATHVGESLGPPWCPERYILHRLSETGSRPSAGSQGSIRLLTNDDALDHLPPGLRFEMTHARALGPIAVVVVDGRPVSFCYPVWQTESLWDVSIDTLESHRGRRLAGQAVCFMIDHMRRRGREPIWGALESNTASLALAARLGFTPVDEMVVFARGAWAYLTAGFEEDPAQSGT
jgi:GNAT superfamily N-acetyltransferase